MDKKRLGIALEFARQAVSWIAEAALWRWLHERDAQRMETSRGSEHQNSHGEERT